MAAKYVNVYLSALASSKLLDKGEVDALTDVKSELVELLKDIGKDFDCFFDKHHGYEVVLSTAFRENGVMAAAQVAQCLHLYGKLVWSPNTVSFLELMKEMRPGRFQHLLSHAGLGGNVKVETALVWSTWYITALSRIGRVLYCSFPEAEKGKTGPGQIFEYKFAQKAEFDFIPFYYKRTTEGLTCEASKKMEHGTTSYVLGAVMGTGKSPQIAGGLNIVSNAGHARCFLHLSYRGPINFNYVFEVGGAGAVGPTGEVKFSTVLPAVRGCQMQITILGEANRELTVLSIYSQQGECGKGPMKEVLNKKIKSSERDIHGGIKSPWFVSDAGPGQNTWLFFDRNRKDNQGDVLYMVIHEDFMQLA
uniref:Uncharacterized protein n=1 Tax=Alexandrium monilatum TaxID=311494 RepID=A0A7S4PUR5_9DINO|mmetsp:Transcript_106643/g.318778  ORF Transcript_106643/g.318778 Transcript_106643/m.318778 type:complete len:363 (+) Transcript_106643:93-1181(+)